jgi:hypothetical protein
MTGLVGLSALVGALAFSAAPTLAAFPEEAPVTETPSPIAGTTATFKGELNPGVATEKVTYHFAYSAGAGATCTESGLTAPVELFPEAAGNHKKVTQAVTGLEGSTEYTVCLIAANPAEPAESTQGTSEVFKTLPAPPKVDSERVSSVTPVKATLEAQVNPNNQTTTYAFEYSKTETSGKLTGTIVEINGGSALEGGSDQTASVSTGPVLEPSTTYFYRVVAENAQSKKEPTPAEGAVQEFTTVPSPFTEAVTEITTTGATFNGTLTPLSSVDAKYSFDYKLAANGAGCTGENSTTPEDAGTGTGSKAVTTKTSGQAIELQSNAAYSVCLVSSNAFGSDVASPVTFRTLPAPPEVSGEISSVAPSGMNLEAQINPNNQETIYTFEYSTEGTAGPAGVLKGAVTKVEGLEFVPFPASAGSGGYYQTAILTGFGDHMVSAGLGSPTPATTYYYRATAENEFELRYKGGILQPVPGTGKAATGQVESFTTPPLPIVTTGEAQGIVQTTATLSGTVDPEGAETSYYFAYVEAAKYKPCAGSCSESQQLAAYDEGETTVPAKVTETGTETLYTGTEPQTIPPAPVSGLQPGKTYYYALVAKSFIGVAVGQPGTFNTPAGTPPIVSTGGASAVSQNSATLSGTVGTNSLQTEYGFEIGTEAGNYGPATGLGSLGGAATEEVHVALSELQPGRTYYYRVTATNADGSNYGEPETFTTPGFPMLLTPQTSPPLIATPNIAFPKEEKVTTGTTVKTLTNKEKLSKALKTCRKSKSRSKRATCEAKARKQYGPVEKNKKKGSK